MLPNKVSVVYQGHGKLAAWGEAVEGGPYLDSAFTGTEEEVAAWLRLHSYVGVWSLRGAGVMGEYVRKERVTA